jgi:hypothetical protein
MPDENPTPMREFDAMELEALYVLTDPGRWPPVWTMGDLGRQLETEDPEAVVRPLVNAGLLHRIADGFVVATPPAYWVARHIGHVI